MQKTITTAGAAVSTPHPAAAAAALKLLNAGGNAVDAAVAALMTICVVQPFQVGFGGYGGSMVVYQANQKRVSALDFDSRAPLAFDPARYPTAAVAQHGYLAVATPGVVAGLDLALRKFGTKSWRECCGHALSLAEEGFAVDKTLKTNFDSFVKNADKASLHALLPTGKALELGERWVQKDLAALLRKLGDDPASFYHGEIPRMVAKQMKENGGLLAEQDFEKFEAKVVDALKINYRGLDLFTPPPPSGGITSFGILKTLEQFDLSKHQRWGAPYLELFIEAAKLCWSERRQTLGDPDFVKIPIEQLLSKQAAVNRAERIRGNLKPRSTGREPPGGQHTANIIAIDKDRNLVSLTATQGDTWGSRVVIEGLGLVLGHGMSRFTYPDQSPQSPNAPAAGKRVQHNMCPVVMLKGGKPFGAVGLPGGPKIVTVTAQLIASVIDFGALPGEAVDGPRVHTEGEEPILAAASVPADTAAELELMGHKVKRNQPVGGLANVGLLDADGKQISIAGSRGPEGIAAI